MAILIREKQYFCSVKATIKISWQTAANRKPHGCQRVAKYLIRSVRKPPHQVADRKSPSENKFIPMKRGYNVNTTEIQVCTRCKDIRLSIVKALGQTGKRASGNVSHLIAVTWLFCNQVPCVRYICTHALLHSISHYSPRSTYMARQPSHLHS